ncbi:MAG: GspE/PulE family protein [Verrucomicrobiota bacterium]|nr:GspE/PulE family protein [Verrucomicrobiota bacterium]
MDLIPVLVEIAKQSGCTEVDALKEKFVEAGQSGLSFVTEALDSGFIDEDRFLQGICEWLSLDWQQDVMSSLDPGLKNILPAQIALRYRVVPFRQDGALTTLLTYDPFDLLARQSAAQQISGQILWAIAPRRHILGALRQIYGVGAETFDEILEGRQDIEDYLSQKEEINIVDSEDPEASVVKFVNQIIREALQDRATDIHFEPLENDLRVRFRIDGVLHEIPVPDRIKLLQSSVISRLKIMSHLDIAERRLPQDGRINMEYQGKPVDVRVATIPSVTGESVSLRLLSQEKFDFYKLGLNPAAEEKLRNLLALPNGIILLTGPTGCGKSTSLYTFLSAINTHERRIVTVEDPVEYKLPGVIQIAVKPDIGLSFAAGLRHILRADPNIVMVGEVRDVETAEIAIRAALTGHLVFSTLHTNDAIGGITRLVDMGVEPFLVSSAVRAFLAQRLVRVLCPECKAPASYPAGYLKGIGFPQGMEDKVRKTVGCEHCKNTGYSGRTAIFEICTVSPRITDLIIQGKSASALMAVAIEEGMKTLRDAGWDKVIEGKTTVEEVLRVTSANVEQLDE